MMVNAGGKATRIYDYICSNTSHRVTLGDVSNMIGRIRKAVDALSDEDQVAELLVKFNLESLEMCPQCTKTREDKPQWFRKHYSRFPELLLIDCTHNMNRNRYQLLTLMVMDQFGNVQPVQHSTIERNADWHMVKAIEHFQAVNEWDRTQVVMVDKDINEVEVLKRMLPNCRILLCHFHVIKWLKKAIRDDKKYGTYESDVLKQMEFYISNMVYSRPELEFMDHVGEFKTLSARNEREDLWRYFDANWIGCKEMWVSAFRLGLPHFRNNTNNRLENFFGKLKVGLESSFSIQQCISCILNFQRRKKDTYKIKTLLPGSTRNANYGEEMNTLLEMTPSWVAEVFFEEYQFATNPNSMQHYNFIDTGFGVNIVRDDRRYHVDKTTWLCNCEFSLTLKMPCRHVIMYRKHIGNVLTIPYASIPSRWLRSGLADVEIPSVDMPLRILTKSDEISRKKQMTEKDKFNRAQDVLGRISSELVEFADDKFEDAMENLEAWWNCLRHGSTNVTATDECAARKSSIRRLRQMIKIKKDEKKNRYTEAQQVSTNLPSSYSTKELRKLVVQVLIAPKWIQSVMHNEKHTIKATKYALRSKDVVEVAKYIQEHKPPLGELQSFLEIFEVSFKRHTKKTMTVETREPPPQIMPFRLPASLVKIALEAVREATKTRVENVDELTDDNAEQVVVTIEGAREFSETTLKSMGYLGNLVSTCKQVMQCYSWLMSLIEPMVSLKGGKSDQNVDGESEPLTVAKDIYSTWPHQPLIGFGFMVEWANLYCVREESWYNDVIIEAFAKYCNNKTFFLPSVRLPDTNNKDRRVPQATRTALETATEDFVFMPINLNSSHWACIVVDNVRGRIHCYDSVDKRTHLRLLKDIAHEIQATALTGFTQVTQHSPTQKDSDSCGLFVCLYFWKRLWKEAGSNYTNSGLRLKRWEILQSIVSFSKKQVADGVREMQI
ncbi:LOW QUALITY PROTEIN: hypothetical protein PHPALM_12084 [Phytophthora palmivora]|uniref:Ubiquitin-like protease family profile domain-containing protein n=1 Tax=Phytophthora palmivora TaxID=4796 RepID=A0A2P4Y0V0_9STRA|nr:LOW QUALITY PROTEIN: hypothetical protein PHPALM_12084 [Phytophthora palmivora]